MSWAVLQPYRNDKHGREKTKELHGIQQEEEEEEGKVKEYREIGTHLKGFPEEDVRKALRLVSSFIRASKEVVEDEMNAVSLDLLYRRGMSAF